MLKEFKGFALRGNLLDIAVGFVLGAAFNAVVQSFAGDILMQTVAAFFGQPDFSDLVLELGGGQVLYGNFLTAVVNFLIIAWALFLLVKVLNRLQREWMPGDEPPPEPAEDIVLLREIRDALVRSP
ncbi:MAG: large conductance mechanosensitive channel protein MscL [Actinomycetota bacterium]|nr:large conductance mechanosensitive channel protein MscL [Actinomycetota bacterium]